MGIETGRVICLGILTVVSVMDIKSRKIPKALLLLVNVTAVIYQIIYQREDFVSIAGGIAVGAGFLFIGRMTGESIGYGDGWGIFAFGIYLGFWKLLEVLAGTSFLLVIGAVLLLCGRKMSRKCTLPFYPFLTVGYFLWLVME